MLQLLTTDAFAEWFSALDDKSAEDVATALDVVEQLGPMEAPPSSRESLLWYEHPSVPQFVRAGPFAWDLEAWGGFRDYVLRILQKLESPRFLARLSRLSEQEVTAVSMRVRAIKRASDPRMRWALKLYGAPFGSTANVRPEDLCAKARALYLEVLEAAGFKAVDVPAHSLALREFSRRMPAPAFRLLYGVDVRCETALVVLGEWLDRSFYGDSVRRAESMWQAFLNGDRQSAMPMELR